MIKQWELFERVSVGRVARNLRVSLNERGGFALNNKAFEDLGEPQAVEMFFDKINKLVGMRPCVPDVKHAYTVKQQGKSKSYLIRAMAFCSFYGIQVTGTMLFVEPSIEDKMLVLDLKTAKPVAARKSKAKLGDSPVLAFGSGSNG